MYRGPAKAGRPRRISTSDLKTRSTIPKACGTCSIENSFELNCAKPIAEAQSDCVDIPWVTKLGAATPKIDAVAIDPTPSPQLLNAIVRAHAWVKLLNEGTYDSLEELARAHHLYPNFGRHAIRAAFIDPESGARMDRSGLGAKTAYIMPGKPPPPNCFFLRCG